jgi:alpha-tubulin suppressor-like RCC1 family protein
VRQVACGPTFALAVTDSNAWSWGSGDGGCLGLGDVKKRERPCVIEALQGMHVMQVLLIYLCAICSLYSM